MNYKDILFFHDHFQFELLRTLEVLLYNHTDRKEIVEVYVEIHYEL